jgi:hypothetical protein
MMWRLLFVTISLALFSAAQQPPCDGKLTDVEARTYSNIAKAHCWEFPPPPIDPNSDISGFGTFEDSDMVLIAFNPFQYGGDYLHFDSMRILRYDKRAKKWETRQLTEGSEIGSPGPPADYCRGSVDHIERLSAGFLVSVLRSGCSLILNSDLTLRGVVDGSPVAQMSDGLMVFKGSPAFPPHLPFSLWAYDFRSKKLILIHPSDDDPQRRRQQDNLLRHTQTEYCKNHKLSCDPARFVSSILESKSSGDVLALKLKFWDFVYESAEPDVEVFYLYRLSGTSFQYRVWNALDLKKQGASTLDSLLRPSFITKAFSKAKQYPLL